MCDYSLHHVASRSAKLVDKLITTKFSNSITRGFAEVHEPKCVNLINFFVPSAIPIATLHAG